MDSVTFGVLTISDTCYSEPSKDRSGPRLVKLIRENFTNAQVVTGVLPDERDLIQRELRKWIDRNDIRIIITTGGTGFAPRDVTPEATMPLIDKECSRLNLVIAMSSLKKTKFAALSRGVCGIAGNTLIMNFPGSEKAVVECFEAIHDLLPHSLHLINDNVQLVASTHAQLQQVQPEQQHVQHRHICPHVTGAGDDLDRNSTYPMLPVNEALNIILTVVIRHFEELKLLHDMVSPVNIPPFRASIKDGYAMKSTGFSGSKRVLDCIAAGDKINSHPLQEDECIKINTGAPLPEHADCVVQVENTQLLQRDKYGEESLVDILVEPSAGLDVRSIGYDLAKGEKIFPNVDNSPVVIQSLLASVGILKELRKPRVAVISTGSELLAPQQAAVDGKIFDSNSTMLKQLLLYFGFECNEQRVVADDLETVKSTLADILDKVDFVICTGGVSMGDKDYIKPALMDLKFDIHFGRVNMKPGKPMTFASSKDKYFFGLPGNPVSAFVTFHLFVLPALRWFSGWERAKCSQPVIQVTLLHSVELDSRPEYLRASITSKNGRLYASINGDQISSRLQSIVGADVLICMPERTDNKILFRSGELVSATVLRQDFISHYE